MKAVFWICFAVTFYAYAGYALLLRLTGRRLPVASAPITPTVSIVIAARNEEANLRAKLENLRALDYPPEQIEILVVSDGSTDGTAALLESDPGVTAIVLAASGGKANALNLAVARARGELLWMLDARQRVEPDALRELASCFADPCVGAVSGELLLEAADGAAAGEALGIYWKIEKAVRKLESASGSVVGVTGAIYAMRRSLYVPIPPGTILDDVLIPMGVARAGSRVLFQPRAIARDRIFAEPGKEFARKVRTLTGNYQLLQLAPWLLTPANPLLFRLVSHKLLRLLVPFLLVAMLVTAGLAQGTTFRLLFALQVVFYGLAALGTLSAGTRRFKPVAIAQTFAMLNVAAAVALFSFVTRRKGLWS